MPANVFDVFMSQHPPVADLTRRVNSVLWEQSAVHPVIKERMRIALADAIGCSYCASVRTDLQGASLHSDEQGELILDGNDRLAPEDEEKALLAEQLAIQVVDRDDDSVDETIATLQEHFSPAELTDLMFSMSWYIGTQNLGRIMHWDQACPVTPIREMVEAGQAT